jgi:hypothetical protein
VRLCARCDAVDFPEATENRLRRGRIRCWVSDRYLDGVSDFTGNLGDLAHPVGAEGKDDIGQSGDVAPKCGSILLDEGAIAQKRLDSCPFVLGSNLRAHLEARGVTGWTAERVLAKNALAAEHVDAFGFAPLVVIGFLGPHPRGDEFCPIFLFELFETERPGNGQADDIGHVAIVAEEVFGRVAVT